MNYQPAEDRYNGQMPYTYCGKSGLLLPRISLGLWHNFGDVDDQQTARDMLLYAFDHGITHFDLANNYGPAPGSAERNFGKIFHENLVSHRDEIIISTKAGHSMWNGPYGDGSSRKNLMASIDQSLKRTGLEYFDIFYSHRYDGVTPIEETMQALVDIVKQGKALYVGISKYPAEKQVLAYNYLSSHGVPCLISQYRYNMFDRSIEQDNLSIAAQHGTGVIVFSPLAQGILTNKYLKGIPENSRASRPTGFLQRSAITPEIINKVAKLNAVANLRGQSLAQMALAWVLRDNRITSAIIGSSSVGQLADNLKAMQHLNFSEEEIQNIEQILLVNQ